MRLAAIAFMAYCALRGVALFVKPEKIYGMFPNVVFVGEEGDAEANQVALAYARALADLITACGALSLGGLTGRFTSLVGIIFPMFYVNHVVDGLAFPPLVPVVAANVAVLALNVLEATVGGSLGKWSYFVMQGGFGLLFLTEPAFLVQDPFTFATPGTGALHVGQKLGFAVGMVLTMHAAMTALPAPASCIAALCIVAAGFAKMTLTDGMPLGLAPIIAAGVCMVLCLFDLAKNGTGAVAVAGDKDKKKL